MGNIDIKSINTIRTLTIDAVEEAQSGHMGMPLGAAPMAYTLWKNHLKVNPHNSNWFNRDRFVLSAGHGSMLLYSLLHLSGFDVTLEDLKEFRKFESRTPGHPEYSYTDGVDITTGPLGQGIAMAVGLAIAEKKLANMFNKDSFNIIDHFTYVMCGDGDLMEGVSHEALSLAGHLQLNKLIVLYDSNDSSLDATLETSFSDDIKMKFESIGWNHTLVEEGNDLNQINEAITTAKESSKPSLIEVKTVIGYSLPEIAGTHKAHSDPIGSKNVQTAKRSLEWHDEKSFSVSKEVYNNFSSIATKGEKEEEEWMKKIQLYKDEYPDSYKELNRIINRELPESWDANLPLYEDASTSYATRTSSHSILNELSHTISNLLGGAADLSSSTKVIIDDSKPIQKNDFSGKNIYFGVREFGMAAIANGMALHNLIPFVSTYFVFSDYMKPAIRLSALMGLPVIYIFTHDSIAVGKDGPTHQPIEQLASFRAMPNINVIRPADGNETVAAWRIAIEDQDKPTILVLARQETDTLENTSALAVSGVAKGGYLLHETKQDPSGILIATGSEVSLAMKAKDKLENENIYVNVVSLPSWELFEKQSKDYKESVLPKELTRRVTIEMGASMGWREYAGSEGTILSVDSFGISGDPEEVMEAFGFTVNNIVKEFKKLL